MEHARPRTSPSLLSRPLLVLAAAIALVALAACGGDGGSEADPTTTTSAAPDETTTTTASEEPEDEERELRSPTSDELEEILPTLEEFEEGFTEIEAKPMVEAARSAMATRCPEAVAITDQPEGTVARTFVGPEGVSVTFELAPAVDALPDADHEALIDAIDGCTFELQVGADLHSLVWAAGADRIGDQAIRGAVSDSISNDAMRDPVGINTYFARILVGDVQIMVRATDGWDGTNRVEFITDDFAPLAQEMVARVEALTGS